VDCRALERRGGAIASGGNSPAGRLDGAYSDSRYLGTIEAGAVSAGDRGPLRDFCSIQGFGGRTPLAGVAAHREPGVPRAATFREGTEGELRFG
jgi:hypothetical protein